MEKIVIMSRKVHPTVLIFALLLTAITGGAAFAQAQPPAPESLNHARVPVQNAKVTLDSVDLSRQVEVPATIIMTQGFENAWPASGWTLIDDSTLDGGEFLWGDSPCWPHTGDWGGFSHSGGADGVIGCWDQYPNGLETWAIYGPFNLSNASVAKLRFFYTGSTEFAADCPQTIDHLYVASSVDGTTFDIGTRYCGNWTGGTETNGYFRDTLDLIDRLGDPQVWIAFMLFSDNSVRDIGMMIDDIQLDVTEQSCTTPGAPTLIAPSDGASTADTTPAFNWNAVANANEYQLQVDNNSNFSSTIIDETLPGTQFTPGSALAQGTYYWRVGANNTAGGCLELGPWSTAFSFTVTSSPTCYQLTLAHTGSGNNPGAAPASSSGCANGRYTAGQLINLTAAPAGGWRVGGWQGTNNNNSTANTNTVTMPANNHTAQVNYVQQTVSARIFLPATLYGLSGFLGPFEIEPNNSISQANGPILLNRNYQGFPNDTSDYFYLNLGAAGSFSVDLTNITGKDPQLQLFYESSANMVQFDSTPPFRVTHTGPAGRYFVRVVVVGNYNQSTAYTLRVNQPAAE